MATHREWGADRQKAVLALFFLLSSFITVTSHGLGGLITHQVLYWWAWATPLLMLGTWSGVRLYRRLGEHSYRRLTFLLILVLGLVGRAMMV